jgi:hypothetical protein
MNEPKMIGDVPGNVLGMLSDLMSKLKAGSLTPRELELFTQRKNPFVSDADILADWTKFYRDYLDLKVDLSGIKIPAYKNGLDRMIAVAKELIALTNGKPYAFIIEAMKKRFPVWTYFDDLDKMIVINDRWPDKISYAVSFRDRVEADEELKNLSANDLAKENISGITCLERLLYELKYFAETGNYLDIRNVTLCSGSRYSDGGVPHVNFGDGEVSVYGDDPSHSSDDLRTRLAAA